MLKGIVLGPIKSVFFEVVFDVVYFPIWWYTAGARKAAIMFWQKFLNGEKFIGLRIWIVNLFQPMYSQYDWQGRLISFFMRLVQIVIRLFALIVWAAIMIFLFVGWLALPLIIIYRIIILI